MIRYENLLENVNLCFYMAKISTENEASWNSATQKNRPKIERFLLFLVS